MNNGAFQEFEAKSKLYPRTSTNFEFTPEFVYPVDDFSILVPCTEEYDFTLKNHDRKCLVEDMNANFKPELNKVSKTYKNVFPVFNRDNNFRSPAFILPTEEQEYINKTPAYWKFYWKKRIQEFISKPEGEIFIPEKEGSTFCGVCICRYEKYLEHINSDEHKKFVKESKGQRYIKKFVRKFKKANKKALFEKENEIE